MKRTTCETKNAKLSYPEWYREVLNSCLKEYCALERLYDEETAHYLDREGQQQWEQKIQTMFQEFQAFFSSHTRPSSRTKANRSTGRNLSSGQQSRGTQGRNNSSMKFVKK